MNKSEKEAEVRAGQVAKRIMSEIQMTGAIEAMRLTLYQNLESCAWWNTKELREIRRQLSTITHFEKELEKSIQRGIKAKHQLKR